MNRPSETYRRVMPLAEGGMGTVEVALRSDGTFRRLYAVKRLRELFEDDPDARVMFLDEARVAGLIRHPNVVSVLDVGEDERGPFLVMELIDGVSASTLLASLARDGDQLPVSLVLRIAADAARGLHAAHELRTPEGEPLGLVHRDVSPQNILLGFDGSVRVTDFGVVKALGRMTRTDSGLLKGKMGYMSPEQLRFQDIDRRSDLFALGIVTYELATSSRLYGADTPTPAPRRILEEGPPDPGERRSDLPVELVELMFELLAKEPELRPSTAREVAERLDAIRVRIEADEGPIDLADYLSVRFERSRREREAEISEGLRRLAEPTPPAPEKRSRRRPIAVAVALALAAAGAAAAFALGARDDDPAPPPVSASVPVAPASEAPREQPAPAEVPVDDGEATDERGQSAEPERRSRPRRRARASMRPPSADEASEMAENGTTEKRAPGLWDW